jgi:hypothetical protein
VNRSASLLAVPGPRITFECPVCGRRKLDVQEKPNGGWWVACWSCEANGLRGGDYLRALRDATGVAGSFLLEDPLRHLGRGECVPPDERPVAPLPTQATLDGYESRLWSDADALAYLRGRGLAVSTIRRRHLGSNHGIVFPVWRDDELVNVVTRAFPDTGRIKYLSRRGRSAAEWYPAPPRQRFVLLVAGIFDVLIARQHGFGKAVTTLCGASLPRALVDELASRPNRRVAVLYDTGEYAAAHRNVERLREAGVDAWSVVLPYTERGADVADWFTTYGRTAVELGEIITRARGD